MEFEHSSNRPVPAAAVPPNHHASHPGFAGVRGLVAAVSFLFGRDAAARRAAELVRLRDGDRLVDIGCGPGVAAQHARRIGAEVIGVDPAPVMLRVASTRWRGTPTVDWRIGGAESLPVDTGWATVVWSLSTVHHWVDLDAGLAETARVLAPGGRLVVTERRITDPLADGVASHGWTVDQAHAFARACTAHGYLDATADVSDGIVHVVAHRPERTSGL